MVSGDLSYFLFCKFTAAIWQKIRHSQVKVIDIAAAVLCASVSVPLERADRHRDTDEPELLVTSDVCHVDCFKTLMCGTKCEKHLEEEKKQEKQENEGEGSNPRDSTAL